MDDTRHIRPSSLDERRQNLEWTVKTPISLYIPKSSQSRSTKRSMPVKDTVIPGFMTAGPGFKGISWLALKEIIRLALNKAHLILPRVVCRRANMARLADVIFAKYFQNLKDSLVGMRHIEKFLLQRPSRGISLPYAWTENYVEGLVNGKAIEAVPDSGAESCSISSTLAAELGLTPALGTDRVFELPNGKHIRSPGMVQLAWGFAHEQGREMLPCWVIPGSVHDLILGSSFLRESQMLTKFLHRIKSKVIDRHTRLRVRLLGDVRYRLRGSLNGYETMAVADSGSDAMLISGNYARRCGLAIDRASDGTVELEFVDGSTEWTNGVVRYVPWTMGGKLTYRDFYVLDSLGEDLVLSKDYLSETNAFVDHAESFFNLSSKDDVSKLCLIRLIGRFSNKLNLLQEEYLQDVTAPDAFCGEKVHRELARRDRIRDEIERLPSGAREAARQAENERQQLWERLRAQNQRRRRDSLPRLSLHDSTAGGSGESLKGEPAPTAGEDNGPEATTDGEQLAEAVGRVWVLLRWLRRRL